MGMVNSDEDEQEGLKRKRKGGNKKTARGKDLTKQWENGEEEPENEKQPKKKRAPKKPKEVQNPNLIKTSNKLIGQIENNELYTMDDGDGELRPVIQDDQFIGQDLEFGEVKVEKKQMSSLLSRINQKK